MEQVSESRAGMPTATNTGDIDMINGVQNGGCQCQVVVTRSQSVRQA